MHKRRYCHREKPRGYAGTRNLESIYETCYARGEDGAYPMPQMSGQVQSCRDSVLHHGQSYMCCQRRCRGGLIILRGRCIQTDTHGDRKRGHRFSLLNADSAGDTRYREGAQHL